MKSNHGTCPKESKGPAAAAYVHSPYVGSPCLLDEAQSSHCASEDRRGSHSSIVAPVAYEHTSKHNSLSDAPTVSTAVEASSPIFIQHPPPPNVYPRYRHGHPASGRTAQKSSSYSSYPFPISPLAPTPSEASHNVSGRDVFVGGESAPTRNNPYRLSHGTLVGSAPNYSSAGWSHGNHTYAPAGFRIPGTMGASVTSRNRGMVGTPPTGPVLMSPLSARSCSDTAFTSSVNRRQMSGLLGTSPGPDYHSAQPYPGTPVYTNDVGHQEAFQLPMTPHTGVGSPCLSGTFASQADGARTKHHFGKGRKHNSTILHTGGADDNRVSSVKSCSSASSVQDDLPLCPSDGSCSLINDSKHQHKYAHTCRLFPCYHGHVKRHSKLFRHVSGQITEVAGNEGSKVSKYALASVSFSTISPEAPNAYRIFVSHGDKTFELFGDWAVVKVHTFKRYLHQVYGIPPSLQVLSNKGTGQVLDDGINTVEHYGVKKDSVLQLEAADEQGEPVISVADL